MSATSPLTDTQRASVASTPMPELPPLEPLLMPSGPVFPEFVYRFIAKLFRLDHV
jgi:hypothetical protein